jgi:hypothetical protein
MVKLGNGKISKGVIANVTSSYHRTQFNPIENNHDEGHQTFGNIDMSTTIEIVDNISNLGTLLILLQKILCGMHVGIFIFSSIFVVLGLCGCCLVCIMFYHQKKNYPKRMFCE